VKLREESRDGGRAPCQRLIGADDFENLQELNIQNFMQQLVGEQGK
jgi:hypothetical protein